MHNNNTIYAQYWHFKFINTNTPYTQQWHSKNRVHVNSILPTPNFTYVTCILIMLPNLKKLDIYICYVYLIFMEPCWVDPTRHDWPTWKQY